MEDTRELNSVPDDELLRRLVALLQQSRRVEADLVAHIGEVDARRLYAREAAPSMFAYCTQVLHLSEAEAYLRIAAARASREHPGLREMLADGRLHLSAIAKLAPHLTVANREAVLRRAAHKTKREIEELVASLVPQPDVPATIRRLPERRAGTSAAVELPPEEAGSACGEGQAGPTLAGSSEAAPVSAAPGFGVGALGAPDSVGPRLRPDGVADPCRPDPARSARVAAAPLARVEPLAPARYKVQFTASADLRDKLERLQALMRASVPDGDLAAVIDAAVTEKLQRLEARRFGRSQTARVERTPDSTAARAAAPAAEETPPSAATRASRHIPAAVRRAVYERDGGRCRFVDEQGRRCPARDGLEFHHRHPFGHGGGHSAANIALMCRAHNRHLAEIDYGGEAVASRARRRNRRLGAMASPSA